MAGTSAEQRWLGPVRRGRFKLVYHFIQSNARKGKKLWSKGLLIILVKSLESRMRKRKTGGLETKEDWVEKQQSTRCMDPDRELAWVWKSRRKRKGDVLRHPHINWWSYGVWSFEGQSQWNGCCDTSVSVLKFGSYTTLHNWPDAACGKVRGIMIWKRKLRCPETKEDCVEKLQIIRGTDTGGEIFQD